MRITPIFVALALLLTSEASAQIKKCERDNTKVKLPVGPPNHETIIDGYLFAPKDVSAKPWPAFVALHGCDGLGEHGKCRQANGKLRNKLDGRLEAWADKLVERGYVVLFPEDFKDKCGKDRTSTIDRALHAMQAAEWLAKREDVDSSRIALIGWSHGGQAVLSAALKGDTAVQKTRFSAMIALYPGCSQFLGKHTTGPDKGEDLYKYEVWDEEPGVQILVGAKDDWTPRSDCQDLIDILAKGHSNQTRIQLLEPSGGYAGAYHGFDGYAAMDPKKPEETGKDHVVHFKGGPKKARDAARVEVKEKARKEFTKDREGGDSAYDWKLSKATDWDPPIHWAPGTEIPVIRVDGEVFSDDFLRRERLNEQRYEQAEELRRRLREKLEVMNGKLEQRLVEFHDLEELEELYRRLDVFDGAL
ncbi:prolyl oligopeptidase family serine peptidase [Nannocystis sp. SCPEA4]|uniref:dienelactone hydrolase family protein n=1 Tax=Nannocystis sp. SCPEA4 TaxID=2996787 RepID=UPI00226F0CBD|nr:prolyl oligopeptidase family serine peptidase [Nannocystis sp. SCPEA4]